MATPNIDALAGGGRRFVRAYTASPWCAPARCSLVTGRWPHGHGVYSNFRPTRLSPGIPNLYQLFGDAGYRVAHVGKCHYAPVPYGEARPDATLDYQAFRDYYLSLGIQDLALQDDKQVSVWFRDDYAAELDEAGYLTAYRDAVWDRSLQKVFPFPGPAQWHPDAWVGGRAVELVRSAPGGLCLFASFSGPHFPFDPPAEYLERVDMSVVDGLPDPGLTFPAGHSHDPVVGRTESGPSQRYDPEYWRRLRQHYFANIALIDDQVGALVAAARQRFGTDLVVVFTADHGEMLGEHGVWGKNDCYFEPVLRLPLLIDGPGITPGVDERLVSTIDILPTLLDAAGADVPDGVDGRSMLDGSWPGRAVTFAEGEGFLVAADGRHKLVSTLREGAHHTVLVDHHTDPTEARDVGGETAYAAVGASLRRATTELFTDSVLA